MDFLDWFIYSFSCYLHLKWTFLIGSYIYSLIICIWNGLSWLVHTFIPLLFISGMGFLDWIIHLFSHYLHLKWAFLIGSYIYSLIICTWNGLSGLVHIFVLALLTFGMGFLDWFIYLFSSTCILFQSNEEKPSFKSLPCTCTNFCGTQ